MEVLKRETLTTDHVPHHFQSPRSGGERACGVGSPQFDSCNVLTCLANRASRLSQLLPLFIGLFGMVVVRWSSWESGSHVCSAGIGGID